MIEWHECGDCGALLDPKSARDHEKWCSPEFPFPTRRSQSGRKWQRKKRGIFNRDGYRCQKCGTRNDLTIDHKVPLSREGNNDPENLWTLCQPCNQDKGDRTVEEWLAV